MSRKTGGNPFFVTEVLAAGGTRFPATVQDAVLARVARLGPVAQRLVETVAIIPTGVDVGVLEAMDDEAAAESMSALPPAFSLRFPDVWPSATSLRA